MAEAHRLFGDRESVARSCRAIAHRHQRAVRRGEMMEAVMQDLRYALRMLWKSPAFALVGLVTLALGIGANTAVFSLVNGVLLVPLPYEDAEALVWVEEVNREGAGMPVAWPNLVDWRQQSASLAGLTPVNAFSVTVVGGEEPVGASAVQVGVDYWKVFPALPIEGRLTVPADHELGAPVVAVVSRSFWTHQLSGRSLDGLDLEVFGQPVEVVGVVPDEAAYPVGSQIWVPAEPFVSSSSRTAHNWRVVGRLAPGVPLERAREDVDGITRRVTQIPDEDPEFLAVGASMVPFVDEVVGEIRRPLYILLAASGLVLLVACTNLASTLLARGTQRARELAVRSALGAQRARIARQLLTESLLLSLAGGVGGVGLAALAVAAVRRAAPSFLPRLDSVGISPAVLMFTAVATFATALLFGLLPAFRLTRVGPGEALRSGGRGNAMDGRGRVWRFLVGTEVALALLLLVGSGLLVRSFGALLDEELGFDDAGVEVVPVALSGGKYPDPADHGRFYEELLRRTEAVPGVQAAGLLSTVPLQGFLPNGRLELDGDLGKQAIGAYVVASAGAFEALDIPLVQGRLFDDRDGPDGEMVAVVSQSFADEYWPGEDPVGRQVNGGGMDNFYNVRSETFARVVGVVGDIRHRDVGREAYPTVYFPFRQRPFRIQFGASLVVEGRPGAGPPIAPALRDVIWELDSDVPVRVTSLTEVVRVSLGERRFLMFTMTGFSVLALLLAAVGIFGVVSYSVGRRTREIGIRVALGAAPESVVALIVRAAITMVVGGLLVGLVGALLLTGVLRTILYEVSPTDPWTLAAAALALLGVALMASWIPARWGSRIDPMVTMRSE